MNTGAKHLPHTVLTVNHSLILTHGLLQILHIIALLLLNGLPSWIWPQFLLLMLII